MIKMNSENHWAELGENQLNSSLLSENNGWLKLTLACKTVVENVKYVSGRMINKLIKTLVSSLKAIAIFRCAIVPLNRQKIKDEFFFRPTSSRKNIPPRTWKRHSALLMYQQELQKTYQRQKEQTELVLPSIAREEGAGENNDTWIELQNATHMSRLSFKVKSVRYLPVWSAGFNEMSLIDQDFSSLRFMEVPVQKIIAAEAA